MKTVKPVRAEGAERQRDAAAPEDGVGQHHAQVQDRRPGRFRAPIAFITPIWRVCWAMIALTVLTTRKPEASRASSAR